MKFSLILATVERTTEVACFLESLAVQAFDDVELIVVDQNKDDRLVAILDRYRARFSIEHVKSARGLSRARNLALARVSGDLVAFPDDDCWYPAGLLHRVATYLESHPDLDGITGRFADAEGRSEGRWLSQSSMLDRYNVWRAAISFSIFLRRRVVDRVGGFNPALGVGAGTPWGAAEESDYLLRCLAQGFRLRYLVDLVLGHPVKAALFDSSAQERQRRYEAGIGRVMRINRYPAWYFPLVCARTTCGALVALATGNLDRARFKASALRGRLHGWRGTPAS